MVNHLPVINLSPEEKAYRSKHFHEIRALKDREWNCCACGNELNIKAGNIFAHPIVGTLQCESCHKNLRDNCLKKDDVYSNCCICGTTKKLVSCKKKQCQAFFCRVNMELCANFVGMPDILPDMTKAHCQPFYLYEEACIKRNASLSLLDVDASNRWICFICESKPLWKLRGVCTTVMEMNPGKIRKGDKYEKQGDTLATRCTRHKSDTVRRNNYRRSRISSTRHETSNSSDESAKEDRDIHRTRNSRKVQNELLTSDRSDSEDDPPPRTGYNKRLSSSTSQKKGKGTSSRYQHLIDEDESKSSSSREFEKTKITRSGYGTLKKYSAEKTSAISQVNRKTKSTISKEQSFIFNSNVTQVLNKFKNLCWEFELKLDEVKCMNLRKDLKYLEHANNVSHEVIDVVKKLKSDLEDQCKELESFHQSWSRKCLAHHGKTKEAENISNDDEEEIPNEEIGSEKEERNKVIKEHPSDEESDKSLQKENKEAENEQHINDKEVISDLDSDVIFSEAEEKTRTRVQRRALSYSPQPTSRMDNIAESSLLESDGCITPTLEVRKEKCNKKDSNTVTVTDEVNNSPILNDQPIETNITVISSDKIFSDDDIFNSSLGSESTMILTKCPKSVQNTETEKSDTEGPVENHKNSTNIIDESQLQSDTSKNSASEEQLTNMASSDTELTAKENAQPESSSKMASKSADVVAENKEKDDNTQDKASTSSSNKKPKSDENPENTEEASKRALLNESSDSDDPLHLPFGISKDDNDKSKGVSDSVANKIKTLGSDSDSSSSDKEDGSRKNRNKAKLLKKDGVSGNSDETLSDISVGTRKKTKQLTLDENMEKIYRSDKKLRMKCAVELQRMAKKDLRKYQQALNKSKRYLEEKKLESLIDIDKLKKKSLGASASRPKDRSKKSKRDYETSCDDEPLNLSDLSGDISMCDPDDDNTSVKSKNSVERNNAHLSTPDRIAKELLLNTSDSELDDEKNATASSDDETEQTEKKKKNYHKEKSEKSAKDSDKDSSKSKWRRDKLLTMKFSESDTDVEELNTKRRKQRNSKTSNDEDDQTPVIKRRSRRGRKRVLLSDSDIEEVKSNSDVGSSDGSFNNKKQKKKRPASKSSDTDSSEEEKQTKRVKRRRIKQMDSNSDDSQNSDDKDQKDDTLNSSQNSAKKGRKNIRKVLKDNRVADDTKQAAKEEEERMRRIAERQKIYNEMYEQRLAAEERLDELILDFDTDTKKAIISVHKEIVKHLKPHQAEGIRFMWNSCFESVERLKTSSGSGCIVAHCMGLGKTLQVISLVHTLLMHEELGIKTIMVVSPKSTILNWMNEFNKWLADTGNLDDIELYELTKMKSNLQRTYQLESWMRTGGVLIIGYDLFRNLTSTNKRLRKTMQETIQKCLIDPGPDLVVCDEGHLLKNEDTAISKCMTRIKTLRRIVLTGTPLQNNLIEYHCMVQFVKPSLLGTKREFLNRFVNPITNGQFDDSNATDVKLMKKRAYVLHKMLKGCVQRFDYSVLTPFLPPKQEYVMFVSLSEVQIKLYQYYLENLARRHSGVGGSLFADCQALQRIWTHPLALQYNSEKIEKNEKKFSDSESEGSLKDFIHDSTESETSSSSSSPEDDDVCEIISEPATSEKKDNAAKTEKENEANNEDESNNKDWWKQFVQPEHLEDMRVSAKLIIFFGILRECEQIGDKLLVFSQSLSSLRLIEEFLQKIDSSSDKTSSEYLHGHTGSWTLGADYFRLDGQTSAENRNNWCKIFNRSSNTRARLFLISTRAGGLGINLTGANRVIVFDASWNPSHDVQSIFRIYRFGQKKPCYVYRLLAAGTMEEKIYNRQVTKLSLSCRVIDEQQIGRHYTNSALSELYKFEPNLSKEKQTLNLPKDRLLAEIFLKYKDYVESYHEHDSLLENQTEEELNEEERKQAWLEYEEEKKGKPPMPHLMAQTFPNNIYVNDIGLLTNILSNNEIQNYQELIRKDFPNISKEQQNQIAMRKLMDMYSYVEQQAIHIQNASQPGNAPIYVQQQLPNTYVLATAGSSNARPPVDNDIIEISPRPVNIRIQGPSQNINQLNKNQEE